jgi:hypothetical protein
MRDSYRARANKGGSAMTNLKSADDRETEPTARDMQIMQAIAYHIAFYEFDLADLRSMNEEGMTINVRFDNETYESLADHTEVSGIHLSDADITRVMDMASEIEWPS